MAELSETPRPYRLAELIAVDLGDSVVADAELYERVVDELQAVGEALGHAVPAHYYAQRAADGLELRVDEDTYRRMQSGVYGEWTCLNDHYGGPDITFRERVGQFFAGLSFNGIYNGDFLRLGYQSLGGVLEVEAVSREGGSPGRVCVEADGDSHLFLIEELGCGAVVDCRECRHTLYRTDRCGQIKRLQRWTTHAELGCAEGLVGVTPCPPIDSLRP